MGLIPRRAALSLARFALKSAAVDPANMSADQFMTAIFGPNANPTRRMGAPELLKAYSTMPWFRAVVDRVSWRASVAQWQLFVQTEKPAKGAQRAKAIRNRPLARSTSAAYRQKTYKSLLRQDSLREILVHPCLDLLDHGNPKFSGQVARQLTHQHLDMVGEGLWVLETNGLGLPVDYYPIPPTWIQRWPTTDDPTWKVLSPRGTQTVPENDAVYFYHPDPSDPYAKASGIGMALGDELETDEAAAKHQKRSLRNFARPDVLITGEGLRKEEIDRLEERWLGKHTGKPNTPYFANRDLKVHELSQTFADLQLSTLRKDERDVIIHVYGAPPEIFGILESSNRATIDAADYLMAKYVEVPRLEFIRGILQARIVERYDERLILDYVSPVEADREFELKAMQAVPYAYMVDEHREMGNRPPAEGPSGRGYVVPFNVAWVPSLDAVADLEPPAPAPAPGAPPAAPATPPPPAVDPPAAGA